MSYQVGYCTNVHAGNNLETTLANLQQHAVAVRNAVCDEKPLGIGLWLSAATAAQLLAESRVEELSLWLQDAGLNPFTLNGFPYGDFHQSVVKHEVYKPTWQQYARLAYTLKLIDILDRILPVGLEGSISTLPLQWGSPTPKDEQLDVCAQNLRKVALELSRLEQERGRLIYLCIEPEPGCVLDVAGDIVRFYENFLCAAGNEPMIRRHIRVCHDICHSAVMFETQSEALRTYQQAGISVGKVQVSSAVTLPFDRIEPAERGAAIEQLSQFSEDRYLHQTMVQHAPGAKPVFFEDLPNALRLVENAAELDGEWRVHFHVPIYLESFGLLGTSRDEILRCLNAVKDYSDVQHFEVETYAWGVLPEELQQPTLADGIANEICWFQQQIDVSGDRSTDG